MNPLARLGAWLAHKLDPTPYQPPPPPPPPPSTDFGPDYDYDADDERPAGSPWVDPRRDPAFWDWLYGVPDSRYPHGRRPPFGG